MNLSALALAVVLSIAGFDSTRTSRPAHVLTESSAGEGFLVRWRPGDSGQRAASQSVRSAEAVAAAIDAGGTPRSGVVLAAEAVAEACAPQRFAPVSPGFFQSAGELRSPVSGRVAARFGPRDRSGSSTADRHSGLSFNADSDTTVRAVFRGLVVFSGDVPGLGNVVVLDHGDDYHTVYAQLAELRTPAGVILEAGDEVGRGGALTSAGESEVYFELRDRGVPVNPAEWLR